MIRYALAALALKAFSLNKTTMRVYREIGNSIGAKKRENADLEVYARRGELLRQLYVKHRLPQSGARFLELGTGWMHWYAVYMRLFFDIRMTTFDVWDNRQFGAFKACFSRLRQHLEEASAPTHSIAALDRIIAVDTFDEVYGILGFEHVTAPDGSLAQFPDASFDSIFSMHVLEHVHRSAVPSLVSHMYRTLKPGSVSVHQIGIDDHLSHYDVKASPKQYISYSERVWSLVFENDVQYVNRLQASDWISVFRQAGFVLLEQQAEVTELDGLTISPSFRHYSKDDLACTILTLVFRRPETPQCDPLDS